MSRCFFGHDWGSYTNPVDTGNHIYKAQFVSCNRCNKIKVKYITLWVCGAAASVEAKSINESLKQT